MSLRLNGQLLWGDYLRSQYLHRRPRPWLAIVGVILLVLAAWATYASISDWLRGSDNWVLPAILAGALLYLVLYFGVIIPIGAYRIFKQQKSLNLPFSIEASPEVFSSFNETGKIAMPWSHFCEMEGKRDSIPALPFRRLVQFGSQALL